MLRMPLPILATSASVILLALPLTAQQLAEGYSQTTSPLPAGSSAVLTTDAGRVYFDGFDLKYQPSGSASQSLLTFGSYTFGSFSIALGATNLLFGESSNGSIWNVTLGSQSAQQIAIVPFNYDAVMLDDDRALVSAKTGGFAAPDNDLVFVDLITGQTQLLAQFPGASGPLAVDLAGDVYYATSPASFPAPSGTVTIWRLDRATIDSAIASSTVLGIADAHSVITGIDAAGDLAFDDGGDLFYTDWFNNRIGEIHHADTPYATMALALIDYAGSGLSGSVLHFHRLGAGPQVFEPFQPLGGMLLVHETDYVSINQVRTISAHRPELTASASMPIPTGSFVLTTQHGPQNGIGLMAFHPTTAGAPMTIQVPGFEQPLHLNAALSNNPVLVPLIFDGTGHSTLAINNPGFSPTLDATTQAICFSTSGVIGSSAALPLQIAQ
jgi:hypothetical protein